MVPAAYLADIRRPEVLEHPSLRRARGISPTRHDMDVWRAFALSYWRLDADDETDRTAMRPLIFIQNSFGIHRQFIAAC